MVTPISKASNITKNCRAKDQLSKIISTIKYQLVQYEAW